MIPLKPYFTFILLALIALFIGCDKDDDDAPTYDIPTTYNFENVSYSGQTQRLAMMSELKTYMATSQTQGVPLDANKMKAMYANDDATAGWSNTYDTSKQLKSKTFENVQANFDGLFEALASASQSTIEGSEGIAGVIQSLDGAKNYLVGDNGLDHAQLIEKGLMGACFYYQATAVYFGDDKMNVDNEVIEESEGTTMEHHWDEAFGYFGVPTDFPTNLDGLVFWGTYSNQSNDILGSNQTLMNALLKGRAAISNKDLDTRNEAIVEARDAWELIAVGSALHYLNSGIANFDDMALRSHGLSEAIGFIFGLQFNPTKKVSNQEVNDLLTTITGSSDFASMNLYTTSIEKLQQAKDELAVAYGLEVQKDEF
ncbi:MAG: DUF4856 domain-containing protein [Chitinophagales bacterium]